MQYCGVCGMPMRAAAAKCPTCGAPAEPMASSAATPNGATHPAGMVAAADDTNDVAVAADAPPGPFRSTAARIVLSLAAAVAAGLVAVALVSAFAGDEKPTRTVPTSQPASTAAPSTTELPT